MEVFFLLNGCEIQASVDEQEELYCRSHPAKRIAKHFRCGFAIISLQTAEERRLKIEGTAAPRSYGFTPTNCSAASKAQ
jgi:hypothetical protein